TPSELIVMAATLIALLSGWRDCATSALVWRIAFLVYGGLSLVSRVDAGVRYALLLIPLATFIAIDHVLPRLAIRPARLLSVSVAIVALQAVSAATIAPYDLSYFNSLVGGPSQGFRYLAD